MMEAYAAARLNEGWSADTAAAPANEGPAVPSAVFFRVDRNLQTLLQVCQEQLWQTAVKKRAIDAPWDADGRNPPGARRHKGYPRHHEVPKQRSDDGWRRENRRSPTHRNDRECSCASKSPKALEQSEGTTAGTVRWGGCHATPMTICEENMTFYRELSAAIDVALAQSHWESSAEDTALFLEDALREAFQLGCTFEARPELKYLSEAVVTQVAEKLRILSRACFYQEWSPPHDLLLCGERTPSAEVQSQHSGGREDVYSDEAEAVDCLTLRNEGACDRCPRFGVMEGGVECSCPSTTDNRASPRSVFSFCPQSPAYEECRGIAQPESEGSFKGITAPTSRVVIVHADTGDLKEIQLQNKDALLCILGKSEAGQQSHQDQVVQRIYRALSSTKGCQKRIDSGDKENVEKEWRRLFTDCSSQDSSSMLKVPMADVLYRAGTTSQSPALLSVRSSSFDESTMEWDDGEFSPLAVYPQPKGCSDDQGHNPEGLNSLGSMQRSSADTRPAFFSSLSAASTQCPGSPPQRYTSIEISTRQAEEAGRVEDSIDRSSNLKPRTFLKNTPRLFERERQVREALQKCDKGVTLQEKKDDEGANRKTDAVQHQIPAGSDTEPLSLVEINSGEAKTTPAKISRVEGVAKEIPLEISAPHPSPSIVPCERTMEASLSRQQADAADTGASTKKTTRYSKTGRLGLKPQLWAKDVRLHHQAKESFGEEERCAVSRGLYKERTVEALKGFLKENKKGTSDAVDTTFHIDAKAGDASHILPKPRSFLEDSKSQHITLDMLQKVMKKRLQESERYAVVALGNKDPRCTKSLDAPHFH